MGIMVNFHGNLDLEFSVILSYLSTDLEFLGISRNSKSNKTYLKIPKNSQIFLGISENNLELFGISEKNWEMQEYKFCLVRISITILNVAHSD